MSLVRSLFIGINNYPVAGAKLAGCVNDAKDWSALFQPKSASSLTLLDRKAAKAPMVKAMQNTLHALGADDLGIITFSGHGSWVPDQDGDEPDGRDEALCPYDITKNSLIDDELRAILTDRNPQSRVLLLTDSCHSGTVFRVFGSPDPTMPRIRFLPPEKFLTGKDKKRAEELASVSRKSVPASDAPLPGVIHISGCADTEYSYDANFAGRGNGALTYFAIKAYKALPKRATYDAWMAKINTYLPAHSYPQSPRLNATADLRAAVVVGK